MNTKGPRYEGPWPVAGAGFVASCDPPSIGEVLRAVDWWRGSVVLLVASARTSATWLLVRQSSSWSPGRATVSDGRNLLGDAVDVSSAEEDLTGRNPHHFATWKAPPEDLRRLVVVALVEQGEHDPCVAEVEVDVRGGQPVTRP